MPGRIMSAQEAKKGAKCHQVTGKIMGIDVLDHVIIGDGRHFSMKDAGHI